MSRRQFLRNAGVGLATLPFAASTYGVFVASQEFKIERIRLALPRLPEGLNGLTLVQLSDIHVGLFMNQHRLEEYVKIVNQLEPDLALITGDFVSVSNKYVLPTVKALSQLRSRFGVFGSIGNHELYTDAVPLLIEGFARNNMKILFNENAYVHTNGAKLNLVGIEYVSQSVRIFDSAIAGIPLDGPTILLSHQPNVFPKAAERGIDLTLSGHTHGGQIKFEFLGMDVSPARLITPYPEGLFELGESKLYVNRGLGTTGPPVRINAVPEITHITVVSGQGSVNS
jgi:predicted MPP superfamily phosphohydrolase